jgi:hypothetical protein
LKTSGGYSEVVPELVRPAKLLGEYRPLMDGKRLARHGTLLALAVGVVLRRQPGPFNTGLLRGSSQAGTIVVKAGGDLQAAINSAQPGDVIQFEAGATFVGNFVLPAKDGSAYITIRTSASDAQLPPEGHRITPAHAVLLPKLKSGNVESALRTAPGASRWRIQFVEFLANVNGQGDIIELGSSGQDSLAAVPHDIIIDRCYIRGDPSAGQKRGIALNSASTTITGSHISDIKAVGQDSQAICGWNGPGPFLITVP